MSKRILLTGVFGPYGVDDAFGRKENLMELFHNQVTKAQGMASLRYHHKSFGLYFLAENVKAPVTVLDFPTREEFVRVLQAERFDAVGISFIVPNFVKAREMARLVRELQPKAEIILGGHGTSIENVARLIDCDHVVRGDGIRWLRAYLGEDTSAPIRHPALVSAEHKRIFGIPAPGVCALLVPGVGCVNACRFCATSHFYGRAYIPFYDSGQALYREACRLSDEMGTQDFFVMDENFLKNRERARELLGLMERDRRPFQFGIFSSAEAIEAFGVENMARLGVYFVWIGAESKREVYEKNRGRDLGAMVQKLRDHGIAVLVSGILFLEHHTPQNIREDIDYIIGLGGDFTQFMMFSAMPGTRLYQDMKAKGLIETELPYEEWHGQNVPNWKHPAFTPEQAHDLLAEAFRTEYDRLSSSVYRMARTTLRGYLTLRRLAVGDPWMAIRCEQMVARARQLRLLVPTMARFAHDALEKARVKELEAEYRRELGPMTLRERGLAAAGVVISQAQSLRAKLTGGLAQPKTTLTRYRDNPARRHADFVERIGLRQGAREVLPHASAGIRGAARAWSEQPTR